MERIGAATLPLGELEPAVSTKTHKVAGGSDDWAEF